MRRRAVESLLLLGGNQGDRLRALKRGLAELAALPQAKILAVSRVYETAPVGPSRRAYLNIAVRLRVALSPMGLLVECKRIESVAGRKPGRRWGARPLDVDVLDFGGMKLKSLWLTLPHPRIAERPFVLAPLRDIAPRYKAGGLTVQERLRKLQPASSIVRIFDDGL
jgi:2-amino-4-hydroxy-6-hydroxymethyldihydropteridine diphosphokinase